MPDLNFSLNPTVPMLDSDLGAPFHMGGVNQSIGGKASTTSLRVIDTPWPLFGDRPVFSLFRDISMRQRESGSTFYRGLALRNSDVDVDDLRIEALQADNPGITFSLQIVPGVPYLPRLSSETQNPGGVFVPAFDFPATVSALAVVYLWVKVEVAPGTVAWSWDHLGLKLTAPGFTSQVWPFVFNAKAGVNISDVTSTGVGNTTAKGRTFRVYTQRNSEAADPGNQVVYVVASGGSSRVIPHVGNVGEFPGVEPELDICQREDMGVYTYEFNPGEAGTYSIRFDIGEHYWLTLVDVTP